MKKIVSLIVTLVFAICAQVIAEPLDLSSFTPEQLAALQQMINAELESQQEGTLDSCQDLINAMIEAGAPISPDKITDYTAETDPNGSLGSAGSYSSKADFGCVGYASTPNGHVGGTVEYFPEAEYAQNRFDYISGIYVQMPALADMVIYKIENFVLRTHFELEEKDAIQIARAFENVMGQDIENVFDAKNTISIESIHDSAAEESTPISDQVTDVASEKDVMAIEYAELKKGSKGTDVAKMQARLKETGFLSGVADGDFGPGTEKAVKAFQAANGLEETGIATSDDQKILFASGVVCADGSVAKEYDPYGKCPVEISKVDLKKSYGFNYVSFSAKNISMQRVKAVSCSVRYYNAFGERISDYGTYEQTVSIADIGVGKTVSKSTIDDYTMSVSDAVTAGVAVTRILLEDGTDILYDDPVWFEGK